MKIMCPPSYHHNDFVATVHHVPRCMSCHKAIVVITGRAPCFHDCIYIYIHTCIYIFIIIFPLTNFKFLCSHVLKNKTAESDSVAISFLYFFYNFFLLFIHFLDLRNLVNYMESMFPCHYLPNV